MTSSNAGSVAVSLDPDHDVDLKGGRFDKTSAADLSTAFTKFAASNSNNLCIFFHGGLVSRDDAIKTAEALINGYTDAGAYPFFFIWNSDLLTAIRELLDPHQHDQRFVAAANRGVMQAAKKIAEVLNLGAGPTNDAKALSRSASLDLVSLAKFAEPYDKAWSNRQGAQLPVSPAELSSYGNWLLSHLPETSLRAANIRSRIKGSGNPLARVFERLNSGHAHGLYTTVIEELFISLGLGSVGAKIWGQMKKDIDAAFESDAQAGGTAFLQQLGRVWDRNRQLKLTLIGHSAGAIYVQRFVEAFDQLFVSQPERKLEIVTLAAAVSFERVAAGLSVVKKRVSGLRVFGLSDKREGGYWEVPGIYNKSLLYIVSSLCEDDSEADKALVGMQRYWSGKRPYDQPYINAVTDSVTPNRTVWARSPNAAGPGFRSDAKRHGGMPTEAMTNVSVCYALKQGV
jgi:hypothetical protein